MSKLTCDQNTTYRPPSIREIARRAGVSPSTVSRVVNKRVTTVPIAENTRKKVLEACRRLNYQPNIHATRLFAGRSNSIAFVVPQDTVGFSDVNLGKTLSALSVSAAAAGQEILLLTVDDRFLRSRKHISLFRSRSIDGMLIWGATPQHEAFIGELAQQGNWPVVIVNGSSAGKGLPRLLVDNRAGGAMMAEHLCSLKHQRIAFLSGPATVMASTARLEGFKAACERFGVEPEVVEGDFTLESGRALAEQLLSRPKPPTAIAGVNDSVALGVMEAADALGIRVPEALSVTGGDDVFPYYRPALTTFHAPMEELGRDGVRLLLEWIEGNRSTREDSQDSYYPVTFKRGATTAPPSESN
ncbi:LacI family DNA-binding transcriptional regulator [Phycisphaerales bacterium AB-hyl4]|uniref:LacI family DNA-binding transcriptional regulator n=1 Tax=Natronomicrosphaera hydrolytica TaxID=3242702 RepID=A0ABV4TZB9_9BACT